MKPIRKTETINLRVSKERKEEIRKAIDALPDERYRSAVEMFYLRGMTSEQIGKRMGYDPRHIRRFLKKALELIRL